MPAARKTAAAKKTTTRKPAATTRKTAAKKTAAKKAPAQKTAEQPEQRPPGRPPLLKVKPELQQQIVTFVKAGAFPERAAIACGISERTHYAWMALGRDEQELRDAGGEPDPDLDMYVQYAESIERAIAEAEMLLMGNALRGGPTSKASLDILERRFRDRWGAKPTKTTEPPPATPLGAGATGLDMLEQRRQERRREQAAR